MAHTQTMETENQGSSQQPELTDGEVKRHRWAWRTIGVLLGAKSYKDPFVVIKQADQLKLKINDLENEVKSLRRKLKIAVL